ncbi:MAG: ATP-binding protein [Bacteroidales bacterium]|jgi:PAS domain S-box-containing protein|nr:ATP-binding protein [Bacteroidales bacterium]
MDRSFWYSVAIGNRRFYLLPMVIFILSAFIPQNLHATANQGSVIRPEAATPLLTVSLTAFILTLVAILLIMFLLIMFFSYRLRKANRELRDRNSQIETINADLERINRDLSIQKEALTREYSYSEMFYRMLIQSADDGISFYDRDWNLKYANQAFYSVIGLDKDQYNKADHSTLIHPDDREFEIQRSQALKKDGFFETELRVKHHDGHYVSLSTRSVTVRNDKNEIIGALTISRDITALKKVHEDLVKAKLEAEASNRLKSSFLANISHEIRTPLNSVVGFANLLLANDLTNEVKEEYIEHINHNSEKLLQIIGDIIDLSRLESSQIEITYEEASVISIINEIVEDARKVIRRNEKSIIIDVRNMLEENGDLIFTDRVWLKRVLNHLMDNAVKFTLEGSVRLTYSKENESLVFRVKDTGIGINQENLDHIFEEFRQEIDGHHRPFEGLGVGLTLAKEVVERMGGKIYVQSEKGVGSEFSFSIPYRPAGGSTRLKAKATSNESSGVQNDWSRKTCLLVDDNKDILLYLNRVLSDTGINALTARSGVEAIEILKKTPEIDVVLLDMQMPEMNGIEATREIRKIRKDIPIIAQTAFIFEDDKDIILEAGCDACLIKPIRKEHLLTVMSSFLKSV